MSEVAYPKNYQSVLNIRETEVAIKQVKDFFESNLAKELNLTRVSAPLFVLSTLGLNDNLSGQERPVSFDVLALNHRNVEIVHSLAKWKRVALKRYRFASGEGLYTDMNAIRRDEELDNLHSIYVDQWDWEMILEKSERNLDTLKDVVSCIYRVFKATEAHFHALYPGLSTYLPEEIRFITSEELYQLYPDQTPKEREDLITEKYGAVFLMRIGDQLSNGEAHDLRAPDYDDWQLNGDILFWYPVLGCAFEISSMGIRVDEVSLMAQLKKANAEDRLALPYHQDLLNGNLPYTIGGGIGQSRMCMFLLGKAHIGEVQAAIWPEEMMAACEEHQMFIL